VGSKLTSGNRMIYREDNGVGYYRFASLAAQPWVKHFVFTRKGGFSSAPFASLNVGHTVGDDDQAVDENHRLIFDTVDCSAARVITARQTHGARVATARSGVRPVYDGTDALITDEAGLLLMLRFADCVPVMLCDPVHKAVALIHSGRQGTLAGITGRAVDRMCHEYGSRPSDLLAGIGPSIGPCCYQVGPEVAAEVRAQLPDSDALLVGQTDGSVHLDLWEAIRRQLRSKGVEQIETARLCTACRVAEFYSHRAERGRTGRFAALIGVNEGGE
jgi:YfiH family protein